MKYTNKVFVMLGILLCGSQVIADNFVKDVVTAPEKIVKGTAKASGKAVKRTARTVTGKRKKGEAPEVESWRDRRIRKNKELKKEKKREKKQEKSEKTKKPKSKGYGHKKEKVVKVEKNEDEYE